MEKILYFYGMVHFQYNSGGPCARILQVFAVWRINVGGTTRLILNILTSIILQWGKHSEFPGVDIPVNLSKDQTAMIRETAKSQEVSDSTDFS